MRQTGASIAAPSCAAISTAIPRFVTARRELVIPTPIPKRPEAAFTAQNVDHQVVPVATTFISGDKCHTPAAPGPRSGDSFAIESRLGGVAGE